MSNRKESRFPKEFRKRKMDSSDIQFFLILLLCLFFSSSWVIYLKDRLPDYLPESLISSIQKRYANIVLARDREFLQAPKIQPETVLPSSELTGQELPVGGTGEQGGPSVGAGGSGAAGATAVAESRATAESRLPTVSEMSEGGRGAGRGGRARTYGEVSKEVGNVGLLGILTSGSGYVPGDYIAAINDYGEAENNRLGQVLASLDAVRISRGTSREGWSRGGEGSDEGPVGERLLRGLRRESRALTIDDLVGRIEPSGSLEFRDTRRKTDYESFASSIDRRPIASDTTSRGVRLRRNPQDVMTVINRHRPAILDCYKIRLRTVPDLLGKISLRIIINPDGYVSGVELVENTLNDPDLENCILSKIRNWNDFGYGDPSAPDEVYRQTFTFGY